MSSFNLAKKLLPPKKAWKKLKDNLQFKSRTSKIVKAIDTLKHRFLVVYRSVAPLIYSKFRALTNRPRSRSHHYHHQHFFHQSSSAIYVDDLFQGGSVVLAEKIKHKENMVASSGSTGSSSSYVNKETPIEIARVPVNHEKGVVTGKGKIVNHAKSVAAGKGKAKADGEINNSKNSSAADKWKIPLLPQFKGIDERAEEFIAKFRQDMKLQREQSILDFQEMLRRSA